MQSLINKLNKNISGLSALSVDLKKQNEQQEQASTLMSAKTLEMERRIQEQVREMSVMASDLKCKEADLYDLQTRMNELSVKYDTLQEKVQEKTLDDELMAELISLRKASLAPKPTSLFSGAMNIAFFKNENGEIFLTGEPVHLGANILITPNPTSEVIRDTVETVTGVGSVLGIEANDESVQIKLRNTECVKRSELMVGNQFGTNPETISVTTIPSKHETPIATCNGTTEVYDIPDKCNGRVCRLSGSIDTLINHLGKKHKIADFAFEDMHMVEAPRGMKNSCFYSALATAAPKLFPTAQSCYNAVISLLDDSVKPTDPAVIHAEVGGSHSSSVLDTLDGAFPMMLLPSFALRYEISFKIAMHRDGMPGSTFKFIQIGNGPIEVLLRFHINVHYHAIERISLAKTFYALPDECGICDTRNISSAGGIVACLSVNCGSETRGYSYTVESLKASSCNICKSWVHYNSDEAKNLISYSHFPNDTRPWVQSLAVDGIDFFTMERPSKAHICGRLPGEWTIEGNLVVVPAKPKSKMDFSPFTVPASNPLPLISVSASNSSVSDLSEIDLDTIDVTQTLTDDDLLDFINKSPDLLSIKPYEVANIPQDFFAGATFFTKLVTRRHGSYLGLHKNSGGYECETSLVTAIDAIAQSTTWSTIRVKSGLSAASISFGIEVEGDDVLITHLGFYCMIKQITAFSELEIVLTRLDLETIHLDQADIICMLTWTRYAYDFSCVNTERLETIFNNTAVLDPRWAIGAIVTNPELPPFELTGISGRIFTFDPILASLTKITLNIQLVGRSSGSGVISDEVPLAIRKLCDGSTISLEKTICRSKNFGGVVVSQLCHKSRNLKLKSNILSIDVIPTTDRENYSSHGQMIHRQGGKSCLSGLFAYIYTQGVSSKPSTISTPLANKLLQSVTEDYLFRYLDHIGKVIQRLNGPPITYTIEDGKVLKSGHPVTSLDNIFSKTLSSEFQLPKGALYPISNRNRCPDCNIHFIGAVSCGSH